MDCNGGEVKIVCNNLVIDSQSAREDPSTPPDQPADSFLLSRDEEFDWVDRNAFLDRKESTKGRMNSNFQRFNVNVKTRTSLIGVPNLQNSGNLNGECRRTTRQVAARFFPNKPDKPMILTEPRSPNVSCIGRVRSNKEKKKRVVCRKASEKNSGLWARLASSFRRSNQQKYPIENYKKIVRKTKSDLMNVSLENQRSIAGLKKFSSERRSPSWVDEKFQDKTEVDSGSHKTSENHFIFGHVSIRK